MTSKEKKELEVSQKKSIERHTGEPTRAGISYIPDVDILEEPDRIVLHADLPGTSRDDIHINIQDGQLTLTAEIKPVDGRFKSVYQEYEVGGYSRSFTLGEKIDQSKIVANLTNGVLTLDLPKSPEAKPRKIEVK